MARNKVGGRSAISKRSPHLYHYNMVSWHSVLGIFVLLFLINFCFAYVDDIGCYLPGEYRTENNTENFNLLIYMTLDGPESSGAWNENILLEIGDSGNNASCICAQTLTGQYNSTNSKVKKFYFF